MARSRLEVLMLIREAGRIVARWRKRTPTKAKVELPQAEKKSWELPLREEKSLVLWKVRDLDLMMWDAKAKSDEKDKKANENQNSSKSSSVKGLKTTIIKGWSRFGQIKQGWKLAGKVAYDVGWLVKLYRRGAKQTAAELKEKLLETIGVTESTPEPTNKQIMEKLFIIHHG